MTQVRRYAATQSRHYSMRSEVCGRKAQEFAPPSDCSEPTRVASDVSDRGSSEGDWEDYVKDNFYPSYHSANDRSANVRTNSTSSGRAMGNELLSLVQGNKQGASWQQRAQQPPLFSKTLEALQNQQQYQQSTHQQYQEQNRQQPSKRTPLHAPSQFSQAPPPPTQTPSDTSRTKLRGGACLFVPKISTGAAAVGNAPDAKRAGREQVEVAVRQAYGSYLQKLQVVETKAMVNVYVDLMNLPQYSVFPEENQTLARDQSMQCLMGALTSLGDQVQQMNPATDQTFLRFEFLAGDTSNMCWEYVHGRCPRPSCRWSHPSKEAYMVMVNLPPAPQTQQPWIPPPAPAQLRNQSSTPPPEMGPNVTIVPVLVSPDGEMMPQAPLSLPQAAVNGMALQAVPLLSEQKGLPLVDLNAMMCGTVSQSPQTPSNTTTTASGGQTPSPSASPSVRTAWADLNDEDFEDSDYELFQASRNMPDLTEMQLQ